MLEGRTFIGVHLLYFLLSVHTELCTGETQQILIVNQSPLSKGFLHDQMHLCSSELNCESDIIFM